MCRRRRRRRRLFCLTLSGHRSQWCSIATVLLSLVLSHSFTLWINVCVYFECYEVVFSQTTAFPVIKWGSDSGRRSIVTLLLRLKRWSRMMQVALVCLMLLPFGWPECVQIFISSLAAQWDRSSTQRYFHHTHTHGCWRKSRAFSRSMWMAGQTFYYIEYEIICLTFGCFSYVFCLFLRRWICFSLFFSCLLHTISLSFRWKIRQYFGAVPNPLCSWFRFRRMRTQKHQITFWCDDFVCVGEQMALKFVQNILTMDEIWNFINSTNLTPIAKCECIWANAIIWPLIERN